MNTKSNEGLPITRTRIEQIFPKLTPAQISRIETRGNMREVQVGEVLVEQGDRQFRFLWWSLARLKLFTFRWVETLIIVHGPGQFTGEVNMISGRRAYFVHGWLNQVK